MFAFPTVLSNFELLSVGNGSFPQLLLQKKRENNTHIHTHTQIQRYKRVCIICVDVLIDFLLLKKSESCRQFANDFIQKTMLKMSSMCLKLPFNTVNILTYY